MEIVGDPKDHSTSEIMRSRLARGREFRAASLDHCSPSRSQIERLLIVRLSAMGDVIHTLPAVQALREAFPQAISAG